MVKYLGKTQFHRDIRVILAFSHKRRCHYTNIKYIYTVFMLFLH